MKAVHLFDMRTKKQEAAAAMRVLGNDKHPEQLYVFVAGEDDTREYYAGRTISEVVDPDAARDELDDKGLVVGVYQLVGVKKVVKRIELIDVT